MRHPQLTEILTTLRSYLESTYGDRFSQLILYGSQARGDATLDSDIDVLVVLSGEVNSWEERKRTSTFIAQLCLDYSILVSRVFAPSDRFQTQQSPFFMNVRREGVPV